MDFIITWVDGNDPEWQKEYYKYKKVNDMSSHAARFRDWDNLQYWFRGVEKFAPWVNKIHFVTWGHVPTWLNTEHPKLNIVKHKDYIPEKYLPTFNSRTIDTNFHRIEELSEEYVYFNDDTFLISDVKEKKFFKNGKPCDQAILKVLGSNEYNFGLFKNMVVINNHFSAWKTLRQNPFLWLNFKNGKQNITNLLLLIGGRSNFSGFNMPHLPQPSRKKTLKLLWKKEYEIMDEASNAKFRDYYSVNHYLQRYWELTSNNFYPVNLKRTGKWFQLQKVKISEVSKFITEQRKPIVCINDHQDVKFDFGFPDAKREISEAFEKILPDKSYFEL